LLNGLMMDVQLTTNSIMAFAEKVFPDSEIVSIESGNQVHRYTYRDAFARVRQLANALVAAGIKPGDRVATMAWNDYRHFELYFAISGIGAVCHTINPRLFPEQIEYIVNHAEDRMLFVDPMFLPLVENLVSKMPTLEQVVVLSDDLTITPSAINLSCYESSIRNEPAQFSWPDIDEKTASSLCYTSGTTGNPKGVLYSHRSTLLHAYAGALPDSMGLSVRDVVMPVVPMFHVNAWCMPYSAAMVGAKLVFPGARMGDGETLSKLIEEEGVTVSAGVPTVWLALLSYLKDNDKKLKHLERIVVGGAACPLSIMTAFRQHYGVEVIHAWGMTETSPLGTINTSAPYMDNLTDEALDKIRQKQGRPVFGVDIEVLDHEGKPQPWDGESRGEVVVRGPWICSGYYRQENSDSHALDGWFKTGDVATMDDNGLMKITDRVKDVIKSGGEWISSIDLENVAIGHPDVKEAAVIGIPDPKWSERPLLVVVREAGAALDAQQLLQWLDGKVSKWWIPEQVKFLTELPHTATGKVSKKDLRTQLADEFFNNL
jgi:fatty-acyl-CoA synthase